MKRYKPKKWLTCLRVFSLLFFIMILSTSEVERTSFTVAKNDILDKSERPFDIF